MISTSPLTVLICSRASEPLGPSDGWSLTSNSELMSPLVDEASMRSLVPGRTPSRTSPETDWSLICPSRIAPMRWSPETVLPRQVRLRFVDREIARDERRFGRAADGAEPDVARDRLDPGLAVDQGCPDVAARGLQEQPGDVLDGNVPGGGLDLYLSEPAPGGDVGGGCRAVEIGAFRTADAYADLRRAAERDPGGAYAEALAGDADLDQDLVSVQLDRGLLDCFACGIVVAERHELHGRLVGLGRFDRDQAGGIADAQSRLSGSVKRVHGAPPCDVSA